MEDLVLSVPVSDYGIIEALAARMGWGVRPRRTSIDRFIASCPTSPQMTDEEIAAEVNAVRYGEWEYPIIKYAELLELLKVNKNE